MFMTKVDIIKLETRWIKVCGSKKVVVRELNDLPCSVLKLSDENKLQALHWHLNELNHLQPLKTDGASS